MGNINIKFIFLSGGFSATRRSWRATSSSSTAQSRPQTQTSTSSGSQSRLKKREGETIPTRTTLCIPGALDGGRRELHRQGQERRRGEGLHAGTQFW